MAETEKAWHTMGTAEVASTWSTDVERGMTTEAVNERRAKVGTNELPQPEKESALKQLLEQFINPLVGTLLAAAVVDVGVTIWESSQHPGAHSGGLARFSDAFAILLIVVVNAIIGFYQERKAEAALEALQKMSAPRCRVLRGGVSMTIDSAALVPGDIVELAEGDQVPADIRLVTSANLEAVEGALTGESVPVSKDSTKVLPKDTSDGDKINMAFMGTTIVRGHARGIVIATGASTRLGKIGSLLAEGEKPQSPLEERLEDFGNKILWLCVGISVALFILGLLQGGRWHILLLTAVSVAVAAIPEGLPAITTITLALGMQRMAKHNAIVRKLPAVETLGCVRVICSDKTGTLTMNEMTVQAVWAGGVEYKVTGEGYGGKGELLIASTGKPVENVPEEVLRVANIGAVASTAALEQGAEGLKVIGDPTEGALLALANKLESPRESLVETASTAHMVPFDSDRKRMSLVLRKGEVLMTHTKGAVEQVLPLCTRIVTENGIVPLDDEKRKEVMKKVEELSKRALRVLALADREGSDELLGPEGISEQERASHVESDLVFAGLVGIKDPPRPEVKVAIEECRKAGIRAVMITGDHALTAEAIARELHLWQDGDRAMTGEELDRTTDQQLQELVYKVRVFARVSPEHKLRIVRAYQAAPHNEVVAMTGDGVNDAPAIKESSIGVAMGKNGTDVARQAADMVLADDNFATIVEAVREGRAIFSNIKKSIFFLLSSNAGLCITVFIASFFSDMPQLSPLQILWINLVTNGLPALALGIDPPEAGAMEQPPREPGAPFLTKRDWLGILGVGVLMSACAVALYKAPIYAGLTPHEVEHSKVTMVFTLLALSPLFHAFNCRSEQDSMFKLGPFSNRFLVVAVIVSAAVHMVSLLVGPLRPIFRSDHEWTAPELGLVLVLSVLPIPIVEIGKRILPGPAAPKQNPALPAKA